MPNTDRRQAFESIKIRTEHLQHLVEILILADSQGLHVGNARSALQGALEAISDVILGVE